MRSNKILAKASFLFFLLPVLMLVACKENNEASPGSNYRIIKYISSLEGLQIDSTLYEYEGDKMSLVHSFHDDHELSRSEIAYPDKNTIELLASSYNDSAWHDSYKMVFKLAGNQVTEIENYGTDHGTLELYSKGTYNYNNGHLVEFISYSLESDNWISTLKAVYEYNGNRHIQTTEYHYFNDEWQESDKIEITYNGNHVDTVHYYDFEDGSFIEEGKIAFIYEGDLIKEYTAYSNGSGSWTNDFTVQYTYDSFNNLSSVNVQNSDYTDKIEYYYEQGNGNYVQFNDFYSFYLYGTIFPHPTKNSSGNRDFMLMGLHPDFPRK